MSLGTRIKEIRNDNSITQGEFAKRMLVSASYISKVESGKEQPSDIFLKLMSLEFNISLDWLKSGKGEKKIVVDQYDYFERNVEYNIGKDIENFKDTILSMPRDIDSSIYYMLGEYTSILKSKDLTESQKLVLVSIISDILASITEIINNISVIDKNDYCELLRFERHYSELYAGFADKFNKIKEILIPLKS